MSIIIIGIVLYSLGSFGLYLGLCDTNVYGGSLEDDIKDITFVSLFWPIVFPVYGLIFILQKFNKNV